MNMDTRPIGEEDLHGYVDGFLDEERRAAVKRYLADHREVASRLAGWEASTRALRDVVAWKFQEPVPASLSVGHLIETRLARSRGAPWAMVAGLALGLAIGVGAGWMAHGPRLPSGIAAVGIEAAAAYRVFAATDVHAVELGPDQQAQLVSWASQQFGRPVVPPDLSKAGFHLAGGRRLATAYGPACMFFYENAAGGRITVFMRPMIRHDMNAPMQPMQAERTAGYVWAHDGLGVGLVTANPMSSLRQMSNMVRDAM